MKYTRTHPAMTTTRIRPGERRKAERHQGRLKIAWRVLGNRHLHFGEAPLKDIGADGLCLQVDQPCPKGAVVIIQFQELGGAFAEPMLLQVQWCKELPLVGSSSSAYLVGCSFTAPLADKDLKTLLAAANHAATTLASRKEMPVKATSSSYPPLLGSKSDKRAVLRRGGFAVRVTLSCSEEGTTIEASVVNRSLKGLGILVSHPFPPGTPLTVQPSDIRGGSRSVQVEVRNCRQKGKGWFLGCRFLQAPPANVLMLLG